MVTNKKVFGKAGSVPKGIGLGLTTAMVLTVIFAIVMTQLILTEKAGEASLGYAAIFVLPCISAVSALVAVAIIKRRRMQVCLLSGVAYFLALGLVNVLAFGGQFEGVGVTLLLILAGVLFVGVLGLKGEKRGHRKHRSYRSR